MLIQEKFVYTDGVIRCGNIGQYNWYILWLFVIVCRNCDNDLLSKIFFSLLYLRVNADIIFNFSYFSIIYFFYYFYFLCLTSDWKLIVTLWFNFINLQIDKETIQLNKIKNWILPLFFFVRDLTLLFSTRFSTFCVYCWVDFIDFFLGKILQRILYNFLSKKIHPYAIKTRTLNYDKLQTKKTDKKNSPKQWKIVSSSIKIMK